MATTLDSPVRSASRLAGLRPYRPPPEDARVELALDANEGAGPGGAVLEALRSVGAEGVRRYPRAADLESRIAAAWGVGAGRVVVTNGGDDAIDRLCRSVLEPGRGLVTHAPSFEMIGRGARLAGGSVDAVEWLEGPAPTEGLLGRIGAGTGLVALVTPNNPTGGVMGVGDVARVAARARSVGAAVLVDLAYVEFADRDPTGELLGLDNVVVVRTFSKAYGLAGLRVGYAIAPAAVAEWMRTVGGPYPVSAPSLAAAGAALDLGMDARAGYVRAVRAEREALSALLGRLGARVLESQANFVAAGVRDADAMRDALLDRGISVRCLGGGDSGERLVRVTLPGDAAAFGRLTDALGAIGAC